MILPDGLKYSDIATNTKIWDLGDMEINESKTIKYFVNVDKDAEAKIYINTAEVKADNYEPVNDDAELEVRKVEVLAETGFNLNELFLITLMIVSFWGDACILRKENS